MTSPIGSWISPVLVQLGWGSLVGAAAFALAWALGRLFTRLSAATRCWLWRLAFLKMGANVVIAPELELQGRRISIFLNDMIAPQALNLVADAANVQLIEEFNANGVPTCIMRPR